MKILPFAAFLKNIYSKKLLLPKWYNTEKEGLKCLKLASFSEFILRLITVIIIRAYGGYRALIDIQNQVAFKGFLPGKQLKLVLAWCVLHEAELMENWNLVRSGQKPRQISPLVKG